MVFLDTVTPQIQNLVILGENTIFRWAHCRHPKSIYYACAADKISNLNATQPQNSSVSKRDQSIHTIDTCKRDQSTAEKGDEI
jgi:hypothetical protein